MPSVTAEQSMTDKREETPLRIRYRIRFAKTGLLRWISHRDLARLWERLVRRAELKLSMTEGFHPKPRIGFPSALALGVEGLNEVVELELAEELKVNELFDRLQSDEQPGLEILSVVRLPGGFGKAQLLRSD
jgi:radical SAM-linked protein